MDQALAEMNQVAELNKKLDLLTAQVQFLTEQAHIAERQRQERAELMHDLLPVVKDVYQISLEQLEEVEEYIDLADLLRLLKRLLRNGRNIEKMLDQLESLSDLMDTVGPVTDGAFNKAIAVMAEMERKGYFVFARGGMQIMDNIVTSFGEDDVKQLGDNIVLILQTIKEMTQPEVMNFVRNTVTVIEGEKDTQVNTSLLALLGQLRDPNVRRGFALTMRVLRTIGLQTS